MRTRLSLLLVLAGVAPLHAQTPPDPKSKPASPAPATAGGLATEDDKTVYALGLSIWRSLAPLELSAAELDILKRAISDGAAGKPQLSLDEYGPKIDPFGRGRVQRSVDKEKARSQAYLDAAAKEPGAIKTDSGLVFVNVQAGGGPSPKATDTVKVNYRGTLVDGTEFDSSYKRGQPAQFPLNGVIACWTEGLQKMAVGGKAKLMCPAAIAYGDRGRPAIPGGAALVFDIELIEIVPPAPPAAAPSPAPSPSAAPSPKPSPKD